MSRKILCSDCEKILSSLANKYDEIFESKEGRANQDFYCDDCWVHIYKGEKCFASMLLPDIGHFNYEAQKPEVWMYDFIH